MGDEPNNTVKPKESILTDEQWEKVDKRSAELYEETNKAT